MFISVDLPAPFSPSRQWISPGSKVRSIWSLAVKSPKRLVRPCSSSRMDPTLPCGVVGGAGVGRPAWYAVWADSDAKYEPGRSELRPGSYSGGADSAVARSADGDRTVDDAGLELLDLRRELGSNSASRSWYGARETPSFSSVPTYGSLVERTAGGVGDGRRGRVVDALDDGGQQDVAVVGGLEAVGVDPDAEVAGSLGSLEGTEATAAGDGEDDVRALLDLLLGDGLALRRVTEVARERAVLAVPAEELDRVAVVVVPGVHAGEEAVHEDRHGRDLQTTHGAEHLGLGRAGRQVAGEVAGLVGGERELLEVLGELDRVALLIEVRVVDDREVGVRVGLRRVQGVRREEEADRGDLVAALGDQGGEVVGVVGVGLRLDLRGLDTVGGGRGVEALQRQLVEGVVVEPAGVGDDARLVVRVAVRRAELLGSVLGVSVVDSVLLAVVLGAVVGSVPASPSSSLPHAASENASTAAAIVAVFFTASS